MRRALARLLAVALTLAFTSAVALAALSTLARPPLGVKPPPFYFNAAPRNVHDLSSEAVRRLTRGPDAEAERDLVRLGGAALPHVLPSLDALGPSARGRVALGLKPLAKRMGVASDSDFASEDAAVAFWTRFWQDRAFDFRPPVVKRLVGRLHSTPTCCATTTWSSSTPTPSASSCERSAAFAPKATCSAPNA
ncbi:MAG: hypothetical protein QM756_30360 [Polyangiaceae bacterium]